MESRGYRRAEEFLSTAGCNVLASLTVECDLGCRVFMIPWILLDSAPVPGSDRQLCLYRRGSEFSIRVAGRELMNSRMHGSEEGLAEHACDLITGNSAPRILIGGLGMGYTSAAALRRLGPDARLVIAELVPKVVEWNRGYLAALAGHPLADPRVMVREADVSRIIMEENGAWDAILLDVDNGPDGLTSRANDCLYGPTGLALAFSALRSAGVLGVWSAAVDPDFTRRLSLTGFTVKEMGVRSRGERGGRHTIWLARRDS
jgi:predicted membrane-bound spermidine synthase